MTADRPGLVVAEAPPNIAFVKYWGKRDAALNLPVADSVSVCLDTMRARVEVRGLEPAAADSMAWNGKEIPRPHAARFLRVLEAVRMRAGARFPVAVSVSTSHPPRLGLAASAAAMAGFAAAVAAVHGQDLGQSRLSRLARLGSGSACRSVPDGFVLWRAGDSPDGADSQAESIAPPDHWPDLAILAVLVDQQPKPVSSTEGMLRCAHSSPFFEQWAGLCRTQAPEAADAVLARDFARLGEIARTSAMAMHSLCLTAVPPILYINRDTVKVLELVTSLSARFPVFFSVDAGANPVLFTLRPHSAQIAAAIRRVLPAAEVIESRPGPGAQVIRRE